MNRATGPAAATVTETAAVWTSVPLVPVIVTLYEPAFAALNVHVDVWLPLMLAGTQVVATPAGADDAVRPTVPVKPPLAVKLIVEVADPPAAKETLVGFATRPKSGPPGRKNSTGEFADTSFCPRFPPPQTSSIILARE